MSQNSIVTKIVLGETDIQESFTRVFDRFLHEIEIRQPLIEKVFHRTESNRSALLDKYVYLFGVRSYQDFKEILVLMAHGLPTGALKILRSLYERVVTCIYLTKNPGAVIDFSEYDMVHKRKLLIQLPKEAFEKYLPAAAARQIEDSFQAVKARFTKRMCECGREGLMPSWTPLDTYSLARKADEQLAGIYGTAFLLPTLHLHSTAAGILADVDMSSEETVVDTERLEDRGGILAAAHLLLCKMLELHNKHFELGLDEEVDVAIGMYNETWKEEAGTNQFVGNVRQYGWVAQIAQDQLGGTICLKIFAQLR